jgi:hypothetical protein
MHLTLETPEFHADTGVGQQAYVVTGFVAERIIFPDL